MSRLFTALWPDPAAVAALDAVLAADGDWPPTGWRATDSRRWHLTLCFHGAAEPAALAGELRARVGDLGSDLGADLGSDLGGPRLRLAGVVSFPGVLAAGVDTAAEADAAALLALVAAAGGDPARHRAHVTLARAGKGQRQANPRPPDPPARLRGYRGPWWRPSEVCLVDSRLGAGPPRYTVLHRVPLGRVPGSGNPVPPPSGQR